MRFDIKIKPIKGCEDMTHYFYPKEREKAMKRCKERIKELLSKKGIDGYYISICDTPTSPKGMHRVNVFKFSFRLYDYKELIVIYEEDLYNKYCKGTIYNYRYLFDELLSVDNDIRTLYIPIFEYLENIFRTRELDLANFIEFLIPRILEIRKKREELYNKTKNIIEQDENLRKTSIIKKLLKGKQTLEYVYSFEYRDWQYGIDGLILYMDDKLKFISEEKLDNYKGKIVEKEVPWFDFRKGKRSSKKLYIYDIDKIHFPDEDVKEIEVIPGFQSEDFKNQMKKLEKFDIYYPDDPDDVLEKFYAAINSGNRFVILAGATGTGKTLLSLLYPACLYKYKGDEKSILEELVEESKDENELKKNIQKELEEYIRFIRVAPNWTSPKDVIGYYNPIAPEFIKGPLYKFLVNANDEKNKDKNFFLILDEMNLSHPEHYLSDILSAMETKGNINIYRSDKVKEEEIKKEIPYPPKLYIIGTINLDETTKELSPRLKSRAFTIEMRADFDKYQEKCEDKDEKQIAKILKIIDTHLKEIELGVGYRDIKHISEYKKNGGTIDEALIQKIIPRIHTSDEKFEEVISKLIDELKNEKFSNQTKNFREQLTTLQKKFHSQEFV